MLAIKKRYVVNEENEPIAIQLDLATFEKIDDYFKSLWEDGDFKRIVKD